MLCTLASGLPCSKWGKHLEPPFRTASINGVMQGAQIRTAATNIKRPRVRQQAPACRSESSAAYSRRAVVLPWIGSAFIAPFACASDQKRKAFSADEILDKITYEFVNNQYYVTGNLRPDIFEDDCVFKDPTVTVTGIKRYLDAVTTLFDPAKSRADLISANVDDDKIVLRWRLEGVLQLGGGLPIKPYTGTTVYTLDDNGLISRQDESWDISVADAFISTFFPGYGAPPAPPVAR